MASNPIKQKTESEPSSNFTPIGHLTPYNGIFV